MIAIAVLAIPLVAQTQSLPIETALSMRTLAEYAPLAVSPDGNTVAYVVRGRRHSGGQESASADLRYRTGVNWDAIGTTIWIADIKTGAQREVTRSEGNSWMPTWSPDGRSVAFVSDRPVTGAPRQAHVWLWDRGSDRLHLVSPLPVRAWQLTWSRDSRAILVPVLPEGMTADAFADEALKSPAADRPDVVQPGATARIYRAEVDTSNPWPINNARADLAWLTIATGAVRRVARRVEAEGIQRSSDGLRIAYTVAKRFEHAGSQQIVWDLVVLNDTQATVVARDIELNYDGAQFSWAPDSRHLAYRTSGVLATGEVFLVDLDGGAPRPISPLPHGDFRKPVSYEAPAPLWDVRGEHIYFVAGHSVWRASTAGGPPTELATLGDRDAQLIAQRAGVLIVATRQERTGQSGLSRIDLDSGTVTPLVEEDAFFGGYGPTDGFAIGAGGEEVVLAKQDPTHGPDLYLFSLTSHAMRRLTSINPDLDRYAMGERRLIEWRTIDGDTVHGVLLLPAGYQSGVRYPVITKVYGGAMPSQDEANRFGIASAPVDNMQILATRGYAVFLPDIPLNRPGEVTADLVKIVMPGVEKLVEMGIADPARLGLTGHSFGGFNTIALVTETTRFRAAMMSAGGADLVAAYGQMGADGTTYAMPVIERGQDMMLGTPWEVRARYLENSPIYHLDRVRTPLLIVHGEKDDAVSPWLAEEIFAGLRRLGREVVYAKYAGEDHWPGTWSYANQLDYWTRVIGWFDSHIGRVPPGA